MNNVIILEDLKKSYGKQEVLKGVSFTVQKGETFALLGGNGAGKTTTLECVEGLRQKDSGRVEVKGNVGVQLQSSTLAATMRVEEALTLFCKWNRAPFPENLIKELGLDVLRKKQYGGLSTGQKRRLHLALALIGDPDIVFLDEPTAGLDVEGRAALHKLIKNLKSQQKTIVLASHDMDEIEQLCDRIGILKDGVLAFSGTPSELTKQVGDTVQVRLQASKELKELNLAHSKFVKEEKGYFVYNCEELTLGVRELLEAAVTKKITITDIAVETPTLEERFMEIAKEGNNE